VEGLEEFEIGDLRKKVRIGLQLPQLVKEDLVAFLRRIMMYSPGAIKICQGLIPRSLSIS
jgi:hypothetical protein